VWTYHVELKFVSASELLTLMLIFFSVHENKDWKLHWIISLFKGKAVPLQAWSAPEGSRKLRFPDFMTTAQDGGKVVSLRHRPHLPQEMLLVLISVRG